MNVLRALPNVQLKPSPAGFRILASLDFVTAVIQHDITITSGADGEHSGPEDPHHAGNAFDVRTHDLPDNKERVLMDIMEQLAEPGESVKASESGLFTEKFFGWIEDAGQPNEHIHVQLRHGVEFP